MKKWILLATAVTFIVGCNEEFAGIMTLTHGLTLNKSAKKTVSFEPGEYRTKLVPTSKKRIRMDVKQGRKKTKLYFQLPKDFEFPDLKGDFELLSEDSGQPVDLYGSVNTEYSQSEERDVIESCSYDVRERQCRWYKDKNGKKYRRCRCVRSRYNDGDQRVRYYLNYTDRHMDVSIQSTEEDVEYGGFAGTDRSTEKVYTYQGRCRPRRYDRCY